METLLSAIDLQKSFGDTVIKAQGRFGIVRGQKVGLIGPNGVGKTTWLKMILGAISPESGELHQRNDLKIGYLPQVPEFSNEDATVEDFVNSALIEDRALLKAYEELASRGADTTELQYQIEQRDAWSADYKVQRSLQRLGVVDAEKKLSTLSGGERKRVYLAWLLLKAWDLLILDEPTNHLDPQTIEWLEKWLTDTSCAVLVVTHDRYFLDRVVDSMLELRAGRMRWYEGSYSDYLAKKLQEEALETKVIGRQLRFLATEIEWAKRSPSARGTKQKARLQRLDEAQEKVEALKGQGLRLTFKIPRLKQVGEVGLEVEDLCIGYDEQALLSGLSFSLKAKQRLGIIGPNGVGKSSLLKTLMAMHAPIRGRIKLTKQTKWSYFDQHRARIDVSKSLKENLCPDGGQYIFPPGEEKGVHVASWAERFGFSSERLRQKARLLSGGESNRLALAILLQEDSNLLFLDEPTNDLDLETLSLLEESLRHYPGAVVMISHDRYFLNRCATRILALSPNESPLLVEGSYDDYLSKRKGLLDQQKDQTGRQTNAVSDETHSKTSKATAVRAEIHTKPATAKKLTYKERLELENLESRIQELEQEIEELTHQFEASDFWDTSNRLAAEKVVAKKEELETELDRAFERWAELEQKQSNSTASE